MLYTYTMHRSKNGIKFHHSLSTFENGEIEFLAPESHDSFELFLLLSGKVRYIINGYSYDVSPMDVVLLPPKTLHSMEIENTAPYERMTLSVSADLLPQWIDYDFFAAFRNAQAFTYIIPKEYTQKFNLDKHFKKIAQTASKKQLHQDANMLLKIIPLLTKLSDCTEEMLTSATPTNISQSRQNNQLIHACLQYINENAMQPLTVHDLAKKFYLSTSHIQHIFKKQTGVTVQTHILNQRMQLAQKLLFKGYLPQMVATMLGYKYYSTFNYHFKKRYHDNPKCFAHIRDDVINNFPQKQPLIKPKKDT